MCPCPYACETPEDDDGPPRVPMTRVEAWMLIAGLCASAALVVWVAAGVWGLL